MFIDKLTLENARTFVKATISFVHPDKQFAAKGAKSKEPPPRPRLANVNLLLGDNGSGKSTVLRTIALSAFGPAAKSAGLQDRGLVRRTNGAPSTGHARLLAEFLLHEQDRAAGQSVGSDLIVRRKGELEVIDSGTDTGTLWDPAYESENDAFFVVGYGATRRVERAENFDMGARTKVRFPRAQRVASLFEDAFSLIPLTYWLPKLKTDNKGRYTQVVHLIDRLLGPGNYRFTEQMERGDYLFERGGLHIPFQALSDGYRAFLGWVADLLYHLCYGAPSGKKLVDSSGVVLVDEIDLHLHPRWQMKVIATIARALPRMQFVFTSHSPLVAGSLEWMNIIALKIGQKNEARALRLRQSIHGLDADQMLLTDFFGLSSTRARAKTRQLDHLTQKARAGDHQAAKETDPPTQPGDGGETVIRVQITAKELKKKITAADPTWFDKAAELVKALKDAMKSGDKPEFPSHWSKIKQAYIDLQHSKCGFCEKPLEGKIEQDVEHYRPKGKVTAWPVPKALAKVLADEGFAVVQPAGGADEPGYTLLAYHPGNYLMACKNCNSVLKKNFFPIAGKRDSNGTDPATMKGEKPYLIYPIGGGEEDPETLIRYDGLSPQPVKVKGFGRLRALVTIEIFMLDNWRRRKMLLRGRAHLIRELYLALRAIDTETDSVTVKKRKVLVAELLKAENSFTNCMRCFHQLYKDDPTEAEQVFDGIASLLKKSSP